MQYPLNFTAMIVQALLPCVLLLWTVRLRLEMKIGTGYLKHLRTYTNLIFTGNRLTIYVFICPMQEHSHDRQIPPTCVF